MFDAIAVISVVSLLREAARIGTLCRRLHAFADCVLSSDLASDGVRVSADGTVHYDRGATGDDGAGEDAERAKQGNATDGSSGGRVYGLVCQAFAGGLKTLLQRYHLALIRMPARMQRLLSAALQQQQQQQQQQQLQAQSHTSNMPEPQQAQAAQVPSSSCDPASLFASLDRLRQRNISAQKERAPVVIVVATKDDATASDENDAALCNSSSALSVESGVAATQSSQCSSAIQSASKQASPTRIGSTAATATANCEIDTETTASIVLGSTALDSAPGTANAEHRSGITAFVAVQPSSASSLSSSSIQSTFGRSRVRSAFSLRIPNFAAAAASANATGGVVSSSTGDHADMSADAIHDGAKRLGCILRIVHDTLPVLHS